MTAGTRTTESNPRRGEQLTFEALERREVPRCPTVQAPAMFRKPDLFTGKGGPTRFDPANDEELRGGL